MSQPKWVIIYCHYVQSQQLEYKQNLVAHTAKTGNQQIRKLKTVLVLRWSAFPDDADE